MAVKNNIGAIIQTLSSRSRLSKKTQRPTKRSAATKCTHANATWFDVLNKLVIASRFGLTKSGSDVVISGSSRMAYTSMNGTTTQSDFIIR